MPNHLLKIEGLSKDELYEILNNAASLAEVSERDIKKVPALRGKTVVNLFLEPSTRTRTSFEIAAKRLSADVVNINVAASSLVKGESLLDTGRTLEAMAMDILVVRNSASGTAEFFAKHLKNVAVINAGDGMHAHPTQALLDLLTLKQHFGKLEGLKLAIVGDNLHSRVVRSNIVAHNLLGNEVHLVGPTTLLPDEFVGSYPNIKIYHDLKEGIAGCDAVMCLRMQLERMKDHFVPTLGDYSAHYRVSEELIKQYAPHAVILHPGPSNRGVEATGELLDSERSLVTRQVTNGVAVRMAVLLRAVLDEEEGNK